MRPELVLDARATLGECPSWDPASGTLTWVDITPGIVHRFDPATGADRSWRVGLPVGAAAPCVSGRIAIAAGTGFGSLDPATGDVDLAATVEPADGGTTMNDGKADPAGRFWAGTKDVRGRDPIGSLYRWRVGEEPERALEGLTISNGLAWSGDADTMYLIDSAAYGVDAFDHDPASGAISGRRRVVDLPKAWGLPDGMCLDAAGAMWIAFWGGGAIRRFLPDGSLDAVVRLPVSLVTSCAFGGADGTDLYVTSATEGLEPGERRAQPLAGGVFRLRPDVPGPEPSLVDDRGSAGALGHGEPGGAGG
jgi:sugar lactone lactonase YvrE